MRPGMLRSGPNVISAAKCGSSQVKYNRHTYLLNFGYWWMIEQVTCIEEEHVPSQSYGFDHSDIYYLMHTTFTFSRGKVSVFEIIYIKRTLTPHISIKLGNQIIHYLYCHIGQTRQDETLRSFCHLDHFERTI